MAVTLCPIAIAVGCRKCPVFKICPVKGLIGDQRSPPEAPREHAKPSAGGKHAEGSPPPRAKRKGAKPRRRNR